MLHRLLTAFAATLPLWFNSASAADAVAVSGAWLRVLPGDLPAAGYLKIDNHSDKVQSLTSARCEAFESVGLHRSVMHDGVNSMEPQERISVPAHGSLDFEATGYHLMLMGAHTALKPGQHVTVVLAFKDLPPMPVSFEVRGPSGRAAPGQ